MYFTEGIKPINHDREEILNVLLSIGAYKNILGTNFKSPKFKALPVRICNQLQQNVWSKVEIVLTEIVEYIKSCILELNRDLTPEAENEFYKVIGEVMGNALEHGTIPGSYAIGFFEENHTETEDYGIFNFCIFNFGDTIYQTFKNDNCVNKSTVRQMEDLSTEYTKKGWFSPSEMEEETLWTLYALQEGVTSKSEKRGNGSIQYIENFFRLKGDLENDDFSKMVLISGNSRIIFDGTYKIVQDPPQNGQKGPKRITFNNSRQLSELPDRKYVNSSENFFPGTLISARILIKFANTNEESNV
jgi:hypothetical protein